MSKCIKIDDLLSIIETIRKGLDGVEWEAYEVGYDDALRELSDMLYANEDNSFPIFELKD